MRASGAVRYVERESSLRLRYGMAWETKLMRFVNQCSFIYPGSSRRSSSTIARLETVPRIPSTTAQDLVCRACPRHHYPCTMPPLQLLIICISCRRWFDVSKQVVGSVLVHIANIMLSMLSSGTFTTEPSPASLLTSLPDSRSRRNFGGPPDDDPSYHPNPCSFYLLNLAIDVCCPIHSILTGV